MPWNAQNVFTILIIQGGAGSGLFVYSPHPGAGNLVASIAASSGTDAYGNTYQAGIASYSGTSLRAVLNLASLTLTKLSGAFAPPIITVTDNTQSDAVIVHPFGIDVTTPAIGALTWFQKVTGDTQNRHTVDQNGQHNWGTGALAADTVLYRGGAAELAASGIAADLSGSPETWHAVTFANSWSNVAGRTPLQYRLNAAPYKTVEIIGSVVVPAGVAAGQAMIAALPAAYQPAHLMSGVSADVTNSTFVRHAYLTTGVLQFNNPAASVGVGDIIDLHLFFSLDA